MQRKPPTPIIIFSTLCSSYQRTDTINHALEAHQFINLYNCDYEKNLQSRYSHLSPEVQQQLVDLATPKPSYSEEEPELDSPDLLNEDQSALWVALPKTFIKKEAILVAQESGIPIRTLERFLAVFIKHGILTSTRRGYYTKM